MQMNPIPRAFENFLDEHAFFVVKLFDCFDAFDINPLKPDWST